jgi:hypothetical protein
MSIDVASRELVAGEREYLEAYRVLSSSAVASCVLGVLSAACLLSYEYGVALGIVPILAIFLASRALWVIYRNPEEFTGRRLAWAGLVMASVFLFVGLGMAGVVYATEVPDGYTRISYQQLQPNEDSPGQIMPPAALELDGKRVFIKGYVYPGAQQQGIKRFVLCRDNGDCCFGGNPKLTDMILVDLVDPLRLTYSRRLQRLAGTFRIKPAQGTDGLGGVLYQLEADYLQ